METPSLADIAAVVKDTDDNFAGNGAWWIIILFVVLFGANGLGFGNNQFGEYATAASQQEILFGQQFQGLNDKLNSIGNGICDSTFALNNAIGTVGTSVLDAKYDNAIRLADMNTNLQAQFNDTQRSIDAVNCNVSTQAAAINANIEAKFAEAEKAQLQRELDAANNRISALEADNRMQGVVRYPMGYSYNAGPSPFCNCGCGYNNI